ncbi:MAG TPA: SNF2-related protein [Nitrosopumilaceae archaeon]|nr:SNF2-related protein [Nitrosopumilaceae archaeon]
MKFRKIQRKPFLYCQEQQHPALFLTMRTGKCFITLKDIEYQEAFPALICVPLSTIYGWVQDLEKLGYGEEDYTVLIGTKENKAKEFPDLAEKKFILTNKEFFISIPSLIKKLNFKAVVVDESTCLKNYKTRIYKFFTKNFRDTERRYILTGTSMTGSVLDIYGQMQFLDPTFFNCKTFWDFQNKFFIELYPHHFVLKPHLSESFYKRLSERCCFVTLSDVRKSIGKKDLEINRTVRTFELSEEMQEIYKKLKEDFLVSYEDNILFGFNHFLQ